MTLGIWKISEKPLLNAHVCYGRRVWKSIWHSKDDRLKQFLGLNFTKSVPQTFVDYCKAAMNGSHLQGASSSTYEGSQAVVTVVKFQKYQWRQYKRHFLHTQEQI